MVSAVKAEAGRKTNRQTDRQFLLYGLEGRRRVARDGRLGQLEVVVLGQHGDGHDSTVEIECFRVPVSASPAAPTRWPFSLAFAALKRTSDHNENRPEKENGGVFPAPFRMTHEAISAGYYKTEVDAAVTGNKDPTTTS